mmetsp:Transcript_26171/g.31758  ORF Transcript_26171/g.31758 Transcript_26171/m.31758 type:complete len:139 (-) Transcript_26171:53-469(-)|eukprot:CAMPEP_0197856204 /NCGR_PEP_ID=MMETSP1438-20131217/28088_1 /TAXON_ID=1461541 /ORGANISM="Pterosperma sp., Strain CCMP1384" /LENGTH=138 /DNA_ID=CAMNT_0043471581 /DNA_START=256 /DNA_END=669 /DNA_ORIENTATION=-
MARSKKKQGGSKADERSKWQVTHFREYSASKSAKGAQNRQWHDWNNGKHLSAAEEAQLADQKKRDAKASAAEMYRREMEEMYSEPEYDRLVRLKLGMEGGEEVPKQVVEIVNNRPVMRTIAVEAQITVTLIVEEDQDW